MRRVVLRLRIGAVLLALLLAGCGPVRTAVRSGTVKAGYSPSVSITSNSSQEAVSLLRSPGEYRTRLTGEKQHTATVMVYMCASDLERKGGFATADLREMMSADIGENINLLILTGGAVRWKNSIISSEKTQLWQIKGQQINLLEAFEKTDMTSPETLRDFIKMAVQKAPADRYGLIMWDHGAGTTGGFGYDENFRNSPAMSIAEMDTALKEAGVAFDFVGFDACLMATLETALVMERHADYMVASQMPEPGSGWNYKEWLSALNRNPSIATPELLKTIVDSFAAACTPLEKRNGVTLSAVDLTQLGGLIQALNGFSLSHADLLYNAQGYTKISQARSNSAIQYSRDEADLGDMMKNIDEDSGGAIKNALESCVIYSQSTISGCSGLNIYFPYNSLQNVDAALQLYDKIHMSESYTRLILAFSSIMAGGQQYYADNLAEAVDGRALSREEQAAYRWVDTTLVDGYKDYYLDNSEDLSILEIDENDGNYTLTMPDDWWDIVASIELQVVLEEEGRYLDLGSDALYEFDENNSLLVDFNNHWVSLNGMVVPFESRYEHVEGDQYFSLGAVPVTINHESAEIIVIWDNDHPKGYVAGVRYLYQTQEQKGLFKLSDGDILTFSFESYDLDWLSMGSKETGTLTVDGDIVVDYTDIGNKNCFVYYRFTDVYGNKFWTEPLLFEAD